jgi:hypothetical protein
MTPSGKGTRSRARIRLLISGVAAGTTVLAASPAALAFLLTGSVDPAAWGWDNLSARLSACTAATGVSGILGCRPSAQASYAFAAAPEEHRKGRRIIVYMPVSDPPPSARPLRPRPTARSTRSLWTAATPAAAPSQAQPAHPSPSPARQEREKEGDGGHD